MALAGFRHSRWKDRSPAGARSVAIRVIPSERRSASDHVLVADRVPGPAVIGATGARLVLDMSKSGQRYSGADWGCPGSEKGGFESGAPLPQSRGDLAPAIFDPNSRSHGKGCGNPLFRGLCGNLRENLRENRRGRTGILRALCGKNGKCPGRFMDCSIQGGSIQLSGRRGYRCRETCAVEQE